MRFLIKSRLFILIKIKFNSTLIKTRAQVIKNNFGMYYLELKSEERLCKNLINYLRFEMVINLNLTDHRKILNLFKIN